MVVFTILMHNIPEYAQTIEKVKAASGFPMSDMIYLVCPAAFLLSVISKTLYHATSEPWRVAGSGLKWTKQQLVPKPRSDIIEKEIQLREKDTPTTITAEFNDILDVIHDRNY